MKNVLLTGGLGYIGSHLAVELSHHGYNPIILDNLSNIKMNNIMKMLITIFFIVSFFIEH